MKGYITLDIETTITPYMGRKASPFTSENWVVAAAYAFGMGKVHGTYFGADKEGSHGYLAALLEEFDPQYIVGFNIKFDILYLIRDKVDYEAWMAWIARGGQLWDGQLVEYLLDGQITESHLLSLDEVAPRYGGSLKIDEVKALWAAGVNTHNIPRQLLMDYLTGRGDDLGDIANTRLMFLGQVEAAKKEGQVKSIQLNNGALVATIEMERNGLHVNMELGRSQASKLKGQLTSLTESLRTSLPEDLPFDFNWNSPAQLSALIFGGRVPYKQRVHQMADDGSLAYAMMDVEGYVLPGGSTIPVADYEAAAAKHQTQVQPERYTGGKKSGLFKTKKIKVPDHTRPKIRWETFHYEFPGYAKPQPHWESKSKPGVYSTKAEVIDELGGQGIEFLDNFAEMKDIAKDLGTYYITEEWNEEGTEIVKAKGMLVLVQPDDIVHGTIGMVGTVTGRFNHSIPNLGNLPRSDTSDVKQMFTSRFGDDGEMLSSDFTSLEVYAQAINSMDEQLIADLLAGLDMHIKRLSQVENKDYAWLVEMIKVKEIKEWVVKRKNIKVFSFQRQYGAGPPKIARHLKLPVDLIKEWVAADEKMYPGVVAYNEKVAQRVKQSRVPEMRFAVHPVTKVNLQLGKGHMRTFDGKKYVFREQPAPDFMLKQGVLQSFKPTELKNYKDQGLGGEFMKAAMWLAVRAFYKYKNFDGLALLVMTVHDALYADSHKSVARKVGVLIHASMLAASDFMEYWFDHTIPVPVPSETTHGPSMWVEKKFDDPEAFDASAQRVRTWLRAQFMSGYTPSYLQD